MLFRLPNVIDKTINSLKKYIFIITSQNDFIQLSLITENILSYSDGIFQYKIIDV